MRESRRVLVAVFCVLLVLTPASRAALPLPAQLSDAEFWRLVSSASEEGGGFISENLVSNELGYPWVIPSLKERAPAGGAYLGVGPEQNFTYMAAVQPSIAFVVDIRRQNMIEHLFYKAVFELSTNRQEFLSRLFARKIEGSSLSRNSTPPELFAAFAAVPKDEAFYAANLQAIKDLLVVKHGFELSIQDKTTLEHVYAEFAQNGTGLRYTVQMLPSANRVITFLSTDELQALSAAGGPVPPSPMPLSAAAVSLALSTQFPTYAEVITATDPAGRNWSYLASEDSYRSVRELQQKNLIVPVVGDFAGPKAIRAVGQYLKDHDATVSVFYVSNVEQYLTPTPKLQSFYANVAMLPLSSGSTFIRSAQTQGPQPGLAQSSISPIQLALDAVLEGRAQNWNDILRLSNLK